MKKYIAFLLLSATAAASAQNPIISGQFTADPTARVFNGKMYLFPSHDIVAPKLDHLRPEWFCMADYHVFSSDNLQDWTDHGVIVSQENVPWGKPDAYSMWAPDCVEKDGQYYFYYPNAPKDGKGFAIGVAIAQNPEGPYHIMWRPIEGMTGIDPCVLIDDDGESYIYWQSMGLHGAKLKPNMMQLDSEPERMVGVPQGFAEGPFAFKRGGIYYLTFPWVEEEGSTETLAYCTSDKPLGPWTFKGKIMEKSPTGCWTNHHSIVEYGDQWYLFYHHNDYSPKFDKNRSVRIDSLFFNADGTIQPVKPTLRGIGISNARMPLHIDRYSDISAGASIDYIDSLQPFDGWKTIFGKKGAQVRYNRVDFGSESPSLLKVKAKNPRKATLRVNLDSPSGPLAGRIQLAPSKDWTMAEATLDQPVTGVHDIFVTLENGSAVEVDYIGYDQLPWSAGAFQTHQYRNLLAEMGYKQEDINAKLQEIYEGVFEGPNRVYFELGDDMAYISDIKNHDVRTEGMSYGMMIAVQLDKKDIFDRLWRWSKKYMQHPDGPLKGYFAWSCKTDGTRNAQGPASDGELYYITSLIFASNRWGNDTGIDYLAEAQHILDCSMMKVGMDTAAPLVHPTEQLITFTPDPMGGAFTDPSYHLPAFYEVWAKWANDGRSTFWKQCAQKSREYLHAATHPVTGLTADYSNYDGSPRKHFGLIGQDFRFDSWRVPMNIALDYSWSCADRDWQQQYADRIQGFLYNEGLNDFVDQYKVDGSPVETILKAGEHQALRHSLGLVATSAAVSLAATNPRCREFVDALWQSKHEPYEDGYFDAYYDGLLRLFAFMHLSGNYRVISPLAP